MSTENNHYEYLKELKRKGELFPFENITEKQLYTLIVDEGHFNSEIAGLFEINTEIVKRKRYKFGIKTLFNS